jgi:hypothetical protein
MAGLVIYVAVAWWLDAEWWEILVGVLLAMVAHEVLRT